jgi:hypothetical protein
MQKSLLRVLSISIVAASSPATWADDIVIGVWSLEWLKHPESCSGLKKNRAPKAEDIVDYCQIGEFDILAFEAICDDTPHSALDNSTIREPVSLLNERPNNRSNFELFPRKSS